MHECIFWNKAPLIQLALDDGFWTFTQKPEDFHMNNWKLLSIGEVAKIIGITPTNHPSLRRMWSGAAWREGWRNRKTLLYNRHPYHDTHHPHFQDLGLSLSEIGGYFDGSLDLPPLIYRLEAQRDELDRNIEKLKERSNDAGPQIKQVLLPRQTIYRRSYSAPTVAERTKLLRDTAIEGMYLYGTDVTQRMYFTEYSLGSMPILYKSRADARM